MRIAEFRESSDFWTYSTLSGIPESMSRLSVWLTSTASPEFWTFSAEREFCASMCEYFGCGLRANTQEMTIDALNTTVTSLSKVTYLSIYYYDLPQDYSFSVGENIYISYIIYETSSFPFFLERRRWSFFFISDMSQARLPAEFKHISKRRKRNQMGFP